MPKRSMPAPQVNEIKFADHTVIVPPNRLKAVVSRSGDSSEINMDPVVRAETALSQIKSEFRGWMSAECDTLEAMRNAVYAEGQSTAAVERLFNAAHDIMGHGTVFGYPLAGKIADSLCLLISRSPDATKIPPALIDAHVDAVRAVAREGVHDADDRTATEVYERLAKLTGAHLQKTAGIKALPAVESPKL
jgi:hypothetical protein